LCKAQIPLPQPGLQPGLQSCFEQKKVADQLCNRVGDCLKPHQVAEMEFGTDQMI